MAISPLDDATASVTALTQLQVQIEQGYTQVVDTGGFRFFDELHAIQREQNSANPASTEATEPAMVSVQEQEQQAEQEQEQEQEQEEEAEQQQQQCQRDIANFNKLQERSPALFGAIFSFGTAPIVSNDEACLSISFSYSGRGQQQYYFDIEKFLATLQVVCPAAALETDAAASSATGESDDSNQDPPELRNLIALITKIKQRVGDIFEEPATTDLINEFRRTDLEKGRLREKLSDNFDKMIFRQIRAVFRDKFCFDPEQFTLPAMIQLLCNPDLAHALLEGDAMPAGFMLKRHLDGRLMISYDQNLVSAARKHQEETMTNHFGREYLQYLGKETWQHDDKPVTDGLSKEKVEEDLDLLLKRNQDWLQQQLGCDAGAFCQHFQCPSSTAEAATQQQAIGSLIKALRFLASSAPSLFELFKQQYLDKNADWGRFLDGAHLQAFMAASSWNHVNQEFFAKLATRHLDHVGPYNFAALIAQFHCFITRMQDIYTRTDQGEFIIQYDSPFLADPQYDNLFQSLNAAAWMVETAQRPDDLLHRLLDDENTSSNLMAGFHQQFMRDPSLLAEQVLMRAGQSTEESDLLTLTNQPAHTTKPKCTSSPVLSSADDGLHDMYSQAIRLQYFPSQAIINNFERAGQQLQEQEPIKSNLDRWDQLLNKLDEYADTQAQPTYGEFKKWMTPQSEEEQQSVEYSREMMILDGLLTKESDITQIRQVIQRKRQAIPVLMRQLALNPGLTPQLAARLLCKLAESNVSLERDDFYTTKLNFRFPRINSDGRQVDPINLDTKIINYFPCTFFHKLFLETDFCSDLQTETPRHKPDIKNNTIVESVLSKINETFNSGLLPHGLRPCSSCPKIDQPQSFEVFALLAMLDGYTCHNAKTGLDDIWSLYKINSIRELVIEQFNKDQKLYQHYDLFIQLAQQTLSQLNFHQPQSEQVTKEPDELLKELVAKLVDATKQCAEELKQKQVTRASSDPTAAAANATATAAAPQSLDASANGYTIRKYTKQILKFLRQDYNLTTVKRSDAAVEAVREQPVAGILLEILHDVSKGFIPRPPNTLSELSEQLKYTKEFKPYIEESEQLLAGKKNVQEDYRVCHWLQYIVNKLNGLAGILVRTIINPALDEVKTAAETKYLNAIKDHYPNQNENEIKELVEAAINIDDTYGRLGENSGNNYSLLYNILSVGQARRQLVAQIINDMEFENSNIDDAERFQFLKTVFNGSAFKNRVKQLKIDYDLSKDERPKRSFDADLFTKFTNFYTQTKENTKWLALFPKMSDLFNQLFGDDGPGFTQDTIKFLQLITQYVPSVLNDKDQVQKFIANYKNATLKESEDILELIKEYGELKELLLDRKPQSDQLGQFVAFSNDCRKLPAILTKRVGSSIHDFLTELKQLPKGEQASVQIPPAWLTILPQLGQQPIGQAVFIPLLNSISQELWSQWFGSNPKQSGSIRNPFSSVEVDGKATMRPDLDPTVLDMLQRLATLRLLEDGGSNPDPAKLFNKKFLSKNLPPADDRLHQLAVQLLQQMFDLGARACFEPDSDARQTNQAELLNYQNLLRVLEIIFNDDYNLRFDRERLVVRLESFASSMQARNDAAVAADSTVAAVNTVEVITDAEVAALLSDRKTYSDKELADYKATFTSQSNNSKRFQPEDLQAIANELEQLARQIDQPLGQHAAFINLIEQDSAFKERLLLGSADLPLNANEEAKAKAEQQLRQLTIKGLTATQLAQLAQRLGQAYQQQEEKRRKALDTPPVDSTELENIRIIKTDLLHELLLVLAEGHFRVTGKYPFLHQLMASLLGCQSLLSNKQLFFNLGTGGGKSCITAISVMLDYLIHPAGHVTYVTTANNKLAARDAAEINQYTSFFGVTTQHIDGSQTGRPTELPTDRNSIFVSDENNATITIGLLNQAHSGSVEQHSVSFLKDEVDKGHAQNTKDVLVGLDPNTAAAAGDQISNPNEQIYNTIIDYFISEQGLTQPADLDDVVQQLYKRLTPEQLNTLQCLSPPDQLSQMVIDKELEKFDAAHRNASDPGTVAARNTHKDGLYAKTALAKYVQAAANSVQIWSQKPDQRRVQLTIKRVHGKPTLSYLLIDAESVAASSSLVQADRLTPADRAALPTEFKDPITLKELPVYFGPDMSSLVVGKSSTTLLEAFTYQQQTDQLGQNALTQAQQHSACYCQTIHNIAYSGTNVENEAYYRSVGGYLVDLPISHGGRRVEKEPICTSKQSVKDICSLMSQCLTADDEQYNPECNLQQSTQTLPIHYFKLVSAVKIPWLITACEQNPKTKARQIYFLHTDGKWHQTGEPAEAIGLTDTQLVEQLKASSAPLPILLGTKEQLNTTITKQLPQLICHTDVDLEMAQHYDAIVSSVMGEGGNKKIPAMGCFNTNAITANATGHACKTIFEQRSKAAKKPAVLFIKSAQADGGFERWKLNAEGTAYVSDGMVSDENHPAAVEELNKQGRKSVSFADHSFGRGTDTSYGKIIKAEVIPDNETNLQVSGRTARGRNDGVCEALYTASDIVTSCHLEQSAGIDNYTSWGHDANFINQQLDNTRRQKTQIKADQLASGTRVNQYAKEIIDFLDYLTHYLLAPSDRANLAVVRRVVNEYAQSISNKYFTPEQEPQQLEQLWQRLEEQLIKQRICLKNDQSAADSEAALGARLQLVNNLVNNEEITTIIDERLKQLQPAIWRAQLEQFKAGQHTAEILTRPQNYQVAQKDKQQPNEYVNEQLTKAINYNLNLWANRLRRLIAYKNSFAVQKEFFTTELAPLLNGCSAQDLAKFTMISSAMCHDKERGGNDLLTFLSRMALNPCEDFAKRHLNTDHIYNLLLTATNHTAHNNLERVLSNNRKIPINALNLLNQATQSLQLDATVSQQQQMARELSRSIYTAIQNKIKDQYSDLSENEVRQLGDKLYQNYFDTYLAGADHQLDKEVTMATDLNGDRHFEITMDASIHKNNLLRFSQLCNKNPYSDYWLPRLLQKAGLWSRSSNTDTIKNMIKSYNHQQHQVRAKVQAAQNAQPSNQ